MNKDAIFTDQTADYVFPPEPEKNTQVTFKVRVNKDDPVTVFMCEKNERHLMRRKETKGFFSYYTTSYLISDKPFHYYFEIRDGENICYYDKLGLSDTVRPEFCFTLVPGFCVPEWSKGAVMYQILVDRFANADPRTDVLDNEYYYIDRPVKRVEDWNSVPEEFDVARFYGGDLAGVASKLTYLRNLGVEVIYFNPIFVSPSNHKYDSQDYDYIDPHLTRIPYDEGKVLDEDETDNTKATRYIKRVTDKRNLEASNEYFADFVAEAHKRGIKIIIDGVFNHCGSFHKWLDKEGIYRANGEYEDGAFWLSESPYKDFFSFGEKGMWPKNNDYDGWWGHDTLPKLNYEGSEKLCEYILGVAKKWVSPPYNVDGWRLDVAADLGHSLEYNHSFWKRFRDAVKEANPDAIILAEHYGDASSWLKGDEWDTIMNYDAFMDPVSYFLTGMEKHSDRFEEDALGNGFNFEQTMKYEMTRFMNSSLHCAMIQLSNHDHSRFMTRTNRTVGRLADKGSEAAGENTDVAIFRLGVVMQMTWPGAPTLYYGDEVGVVGFTDPDSRRTYPWENPDENLKDFYRDAISLRKSTRALRHGSFMFLESGKGYVAYARFTTAEKYIIIVNMDEGAKSLCLPVWRAEVPFACELIRVFTTNETGYSSFPNKYAVINGLLTITLEQKSAFVLKISQ